MRRISNNTTKEVDIMQNSIFPDKFRILSGSMLKLIAMIAMLIDHTAFILAPVIPLLKLPLIAVAGKEITLYWIMRKIGRIAFPIFSFLITEGYVHTRNKIKYGLNMLLFALISEIPFNLFYNRLLYPGYQNVFFTLFLGVSLIYVMENINKEWKKAILLSLILLLSIFLKVDYGMKGTLIILLIFLLKNRPATQAILCYPLLSGGLAALAAFLPINLYNGERGFIKTKTLKYTFYIFYPVHIVILFAVKSILK